MRAGREDTETVGEVMAAGPRIPALAPGTVVAGRFEIVRALGSGGSSIVYEALDTTLQTRVALKILRSDRDTPAALKRLRREASIAREANDPRLVRVWDIGDAPEGAFISMELVEGESLRAVIERGPLPVGDAIRIGTEVLSALEKLHALGVIHRDLKPSNVLLTPERGVKLVDFGLARHWESDESRATQADALVGTVEYLSPEQALGRTLDPRTDLYSFGVLLFEMLTGAVPFRSESTLGAVLAHVRESAPDVRKLRPDVPSWLARVIARLLEKRPGDRYASAAQVLRDLRRGRAGVSVARRTWIAVAVIAALVIVPLVVWRIARPRLASVATGRNGVEAIDSRGEVLWTFPASASLSAVTHRDGRISDVAVLGGAENGTYSVFLLDPESGEVRRTIPIPDETHAFAGYARDFHPMMLRAVDINRDGRDEIVCGMQHRYWPFYAVLVEPFAGTARTILVASGAHNLIAAVNLDDTPNDELVFAGVNNLLGWYSSIIAIRVGADAQIRDPFLHHPAATPDRDTANTNFDDVVWYELLAPGWFAYASADVDPARRTIALPYNDGRTVRLGFDGFVIGSDSSLSPPERLAARQRAFGLVRSIKRSLALHDMKGALPEIERALALAQAAGSPYLAEWCRRARAAALVRTGAAEDAMGEFEALARDSSSPGDACWDAAKAFHLQGDMRRAVHWYERGLASSGNVGRMKADFIEAALLAFASARDFAGARAFLDRSVRAHPGVGENRPMFESFLQWQQTGSAPVPPPPGSRPGDFQRSIYLELRNAAGIAPAELLREMDALGPFSELGAVPMSLRADLLRRAGDSRAALPLARRAYEEATLRGADDPVLAYFIPLIRARYEVAAAKLIR